MILIIVSSLSTPMNCRSVSSVSSPVLLLFLQVGRQGLREARNSLMNINDKVK